MRLYYALMIALSLIKSITDKEQAGFYWIAAALFAVAQSNIY